MRILVIDDHPLFGAGLVAAVQQQANRMAVPVQLASATTLELGLEVALQFGPDVLLLDYHLPDTSGLQMLQVFASRFPWTARVVMSGDERAEVLAAVRANGASGFISKTDPAETVWQALQTIAAGQEWWPDRLPGGVLAPALAMAQNMAAFKNSADQLTPRQSQVLRYIDQGLSNNEIALALAITERTVKQHMSDLLGKTATTNRDTLLQAARSRGWLL
jgi:DNA-binding NarL/FixJ family response regulator